MSEPGGSDDRATGEPPAGAGADDRPAGQPPAGAGAVVRVLEICNKRGLHARASAKFVQTVEKFDADVRVTRAGETVGGTSIMGLMMLAAGPGSTITVEATGAEAEAVVEALAALVGGRFTEQE
jgi:phosphocarrier protein HPr